MVDRKVGKNCTGCSACFNACPKAAISMQPDSEGFLYPRIDTKSCIGCGLCERACPVLNDPAGKYTPPDVYAAWNKDEEIRINSTSGGVFSAMAEEFMKSGGYVCGAVYGSDFSIFHELCSEITDIPALRQSKYAQSDLRDCFARIKKILKAGRSVLFCGSPCQCAGLQTYLGREYPELYTCDFICRGIISREVYRKYLQDTEKQSGSRVSRVHFKNKDYGWNRFSTKLSMENGSVYQKDRNNDPYMKGYLRHNLYIRPACHSCRFKSIPRSSDISLGDFWGIGNFRSELDSNKGTSAVLVNSEKGKKLWNMAARHLDYDMRTLEEVTAGNSCLLNSAPAGEYRQYFFDNMYKYPFDRLIAKIDDKAMGLTVTDRFLRWIHITKVRLLGEDK